MKRTITNLKQATTNLLCPNRFGGTAMPRRIYRNHNFYKRFVIHQVHHGPEKRGLLSCSPFSKSRKNSSCKHIRQRTAFAGRCGSSWLAADAKFSRKSPYQIDSCARNVILIFHPLNTDILFARRYLKRKRFSDVHFCIQVRWLFVTFPLRNIGGRNPIIQPNVPDYFAIVKKICVGHPTIVFKNNTELTF